MQLPLIIILAFHVLAAVFWAGSTFALARWSGSAEDRLFGPQMGSAMIAVPMGSDPVASAASS